MNQYPPHSLGQCLDRLSPRARRKYDALQAAVADSEALQRSLQERIKTQEERLARLAQRRDYVAGTDASEAARLDRELAAVRADLDKLERERFKRNAARANSEQVVSRLNNFIMQFYSGAIDIERPVWPTAVPGAREGESIGDALMRVRREIAGAQGELMRVKVAPPPAREVRAAIEAEIDRMAGGGTPRVSIDGGRITINWPDVMLYAQPGSALSAPSGSASKLLCALFPEQLKKLLVAGLTDLKGSIPSSERPQRIREIETRLLGLEIGEERLVMAALEQGLECHRRVDASPWAVLFVEEAVAEAAE